jgi:hypothetical protein
MKQETGARGWTFPHTIRVSRSSLFHTTTTTLCAARVIAV